MIYLFKTKKLSLKIKKFFINCIKFLYNVDFDSYELIHVIHLMQEFI